MGIKNISDLDLIENFIIKKASASFWFFYKYINFDLKIGWFQKEIAESLQKFYEDLKAHKRPKLLISAPPQHGKTQMTVDFLIWLSGKNPDLRIIYASYAGMLGEEANLRMQRIIKSEKFQKVFPETRISNSNAEKWKCNSEGMEFVERRGSFRNTTVQGAITGARLDIGVIDDPIKGRAESNSKTVRDKTWGWFTNDFLTRFSDEAGFLTIATRWHVDDPIGRLIKQFEGDETLKVLKYEAIATEKSKFRDEGEALFPQHKSLDFLNLRKKLLSRSDWEALYQQNPQILGGQLLKSSWFHLYDEPPRFKQRMIYADTAQKTKEANDFSVFECWGEGEDGKIYLVDLIRGKWEAPDLKKIAISFWQKHKAIPVLKNGALRGLKVEDKSSGTGLIQEIKRDGGIPIFAIERIKDKYTRLGDVMGYIEAGLVCLPKNAPFLMDFLTECEEMSADNSHRHDDQIDPMIDAITDLLCHNDIKIWENFI